jgi:hypothetical protein
VFLGGFAEDCRMQMEAALLSSFDDGLTYSGFQMGATQLVRLRPRRQSLAGVSR